MGAQQSSTAKVSTVDKLITDSSVRGRKSNTNTPGLVASNVSIEEGFVISGESNFTASLEEDDVTEESSLYDSDEEEEDEDEGKFRRKRLASGDTIGYSLAHVGTLAQRNVFAFWRMLGASNVSVASTCTPTPLLRSTGLSKPAASSTASRLSRVRPLRKRRNVLWP